MKSRLAKRMSVTISAALLSATTILVAQPAASPLDVHGMEQQSISGARSRAMGGTGIASANDASALFSNPALLSRLSSFEVRGSGLVGMTLREQSQEWVPMRPLPGISVLFEGLTGGIKTPTDTAGNPLDPWTTLQRQYDIIVPNWKKGAPIGQPLMLAAAMPLTVMDMDLTAAVGVAQIVDLDSYYQNNNSMTPYLGQERPLQTFFTNRTDTVHVKWYQYSRLREGSVYGITPGVSVRLLPGLTVGASAAFLTGSSDDKENRVERGHLNISISNGVPNNFMLDTVYYYQSKIGTSSYAGKILTFGLHLEQARYSIGLVVKPPTALSRTWSRTVSSIDTTRKSFPVRIDSNTTSTYSESGKEFVNYPLAYALGIVIKPSDKWTIAFDYEMRNLADVEVASPSPGAPTRPWVSRLAVMRFGAEYCPNSTLALRGGYREDIQAFSPDGSGIIDEPARGGVYSLGAGLKVGGVLFDFAYEYAILKYEDIYQSNANHNTRARHAFVMEAAYRF